MKPLVICTLILSSTAHAGDAKAYTGANNCVTSGGTASYSYGRLLNSSTSSTMTATCNLLVDSGDAYSFSKTEIWILDSTTTGSVSCTQYSKYQSSSSITTSSKSASYPSAAGSTTTYTSTTPTELTISSGSGYGFGHSYPIWNYLSCTVPAAASSSSSDQSGIVAYFAQEGS